jgi:uncharacterized RDD family membrane protein YckC
VGTFLVVNGRGELRAGIPRRLLADLVDGLLIGAAALPSHAVLRALGYDGRSRLALAVFVALAGYAYAVLFICRRGATLGKEVAAIRVVDLNSGDHPSLGSAAIREARYLLGPVPPFVRLLGGVLVLPILWRKDQRGWHDQLAGTIVLRRETS